MTCAEARALFSDLIDDELPPGERAAADAHLAGCVECRNELDRLARTVSMMRALPPERAPGGFVDRVVDAAHPQGWTARLARRLFVPLGLKVPVHAAAVVMVAATAVWVFQGTPELQQAARQEAPAPPPAMERRAAPAPPPAVEPRAAPAPPSSTPLRDAAPPTPAVSSDAVNPPVAPGPPSETRQKLERAEPMPARERDTRAADANKLAEAGQARAQEAPASESLAKRAAPGRAAGARPADVTATWSVPDRSAALRELDALVTRLGGGPVAYGSEGAVDTAAFSVPREAYEELARELARLGPLTGGPAPGALPASVRVSLRISR